VFVYQSLLQQQQSEKEKLDLLQQQQMLAQATKAGLAEGRARAFATLHGFQ
jgi:uncharacterized protein YpmB